MPTIHWHPRVGFVDHDGAAIPKRFKISAERIQLLPRFDPDAEGNFDLDLEVEVTPNGTGRCLGLNVRPLEGAVVSGQVVRNVPVARLLRESIARAAWKVHGPGMIGPADPGFYERLAGDVRRPKRGSEITDDELRTIANIYRAALKRGDHPTQAVCMEFHPKRAIPRSTASRWIKRARKRGMLAPAEHGRATA